MFHQGGSFPKKPNLVISHFLPLQGQMESGDAISTPLLLQEPLLLLDSQCPLEAMHGFH